LVTNIFHVVVSPKYTFPIPHLHPNSIVINHWFPLASIMCWVKCSLHWNQCGLTLTSVEWVLYKAHHWSSNLDQFDPFQLETLGGFWFETFNNELSIPPTKMSTSIDFLCGCSKDDGLTCSSSKRTSYFCSFNDFHDLSNLTSLKI